MHLCLEESSTDKTFINTGSLADWPMCTYPHTSCPFSFANSSQGNQIGAAFWCAVPRRDEFFPSNSIAGNKSLENMDLMVQECTYI